jgi:uncharacterized protein YxjI
MQLIPNLIFILIGLISFYYAYTQIHLKRIIENLPTSKIRSLSLGLVELCGKAQPKHQTYISPFSKTECIYYNYKVYEYRTSSTSKGQNSSWHKIKDRTQKDDFYLDDTTGKATIQIEKAKLDIPKTFKIESGLFSSLTDEIKTTLSNEGINTKSLFGFNKKLKIEEYSIPTNTDLYILGNATRDNNNEITISKKKILYISTKSEKELLKSLRNKIIISLIIGFGFLIIGSLFFYM